MSYFEKFKDWNIRNKDMGVTAEQYTVIKQILEQADKEIINQKSREAQIIKVNHLLKVDKEILKKHIEDKDEVVKDKNLIIVGLIAVIGIAVGTYGIIIHYLSNL